GVSGFQVRIYGGTVTSGRYAVNLGSAAALTLSGSPALSGTTSDLLLSTQSGTVLTATKVDATGYTGETVTVWENNLNSNTVGAYAIRGGGGKFTLVNAGDYEYAYQDGGYVIQEKGQHVH